MFGYSVGQLEEIAQSTLQFACLNGATSADVSVSEALGQAVSVRLQETDQIEYQHDKNLGFTVFIGHQKGYASTADFSESAIQQTVMAALNIAKYTGQDKFAGLAEPELMARHAEDLQLYFPWHITTDDALALAKRCEQVALDRDSRICNSEGATVNIGHYQGVYANTYGFMAGYQSSRHGLSCIVLAGKSDAMQRDYWYTQARDALDLEVPEQVGKMAAERVLRRLNPRSIKTGQYPIIFDSITAGSLLGNIVSALSGGNLYRHMSFLQDSLGQPRLSQSFNLYEDPFVKKGMASGYFDAEGVATKARNVIKDGIIEGYFLGSYSARKLGMQTTGNAGGAHNLIVSATLPTLDELLKKMGTGILITELMGQGVNLLTGDYSRGAAGFWVENGEIVHPVEEMTIAGNLNQMLLDIVDIADDAVKYGAHRIGSVLIDRMTVAGNG